MSTGNDQLDSDLWFRIQEKIKESLDYHSYKNWFSNTQFKSYIDGKLTVTVPTQFVANWLKVHYLDTVGECAAQMIPDFQEVQFVAPSDVAESVASAKHDGANALTRNRLRHDANRDEFSYRYTFDRFVVGSSNRFAHAAAKAVAESPARAYNPLFLYGCTGLGKTHLMQAIGQEIVKHNPRANVSFVSCEQFTNQLIESIAKKSTKRFRSKYRKVDVLLIDDVQFIGGKEATQEEFFYTFNSLYEGHKQIVLSSDRPPKEIDRLEARLVSRFEWGLVTDIQPPDLETRLAILRNRVNQENLSVTKDAIQYIATYITKNVRELEGALVTVAAFSKLAQKHIDLFMVEDVLKDLVQRNAIKPITVDSILRVVAEHFDVRLSDLCGRSRQRQISYPRQVAMYLCKTMIPNLSLAEVGEFFGGKDHTTVLYAYQKVTRDLKSDLGLERVLAHLEKAIRS